MKLDQTPIANAPALTVQATGSSVSINGVVFNFDRLSVGDTLPRSAVDCAALTSDVARTIDGISMTLVAGYIPPGSQDQRWPEAITSAPDIVGGEAGLIDWTQLLTAEAATAANIAAARQSMRSYKRALRQAMKLFPSASHPHLLAQIDDAVAALPEYDPAKDAWADVTQFERMNPDVQALAVPFGFDDSMLDALFNVAMALERGASAADAMAVANL